MEELVGLMVKPTSTNYSIWKPQIEDILYCKDLYNPILGEAKPLDKSDKDWEVLHRKPWLIFDDGLIRAFFIMWLKKPMPTLCGQNLKPCMNARRHKTNPP